VRETHRGPLIHYILCGFGSYAFQDNISLIWTGFSDEYDPIVSISHLAEFKTLPSLKKFILEDTKFHFNVNAAFITRDGHIGYQQLGRYPIRANPESGLYIKDGTTTDHDWLGFVPHTHRLQVIDPPSGYIVSANNKIASSEYYNGLHDYAIYTARSDRLHQVISEGIAKGRKFTVEDAK
jgi:penicillin amidase